MNPHEFDRWLADPNRRPLVMGILNVTPDSFSDGGQFLARDAAVAHGRQLIEQGADLVDIGGESTRPGSQPVGAAEQIRRITPVIEALATDAGITLSVDTTRADVADAALQAGATLINDVSAGRFDPPIMALAARRSAPLILMHMLGSPATMQVNPVYDDVVAQVADFLNQRITAAASAGIPPHRILLDPGIGFGKTVQHNLALLRCLPELRRRTATAAGAAHAWVVGTSRKSFIAKVTGEDMDASAADRRLFGTAATVAWSITNGASVVRVHDVKPMAQIVKMIQAISDARR
jgi:dihydropteroate synthase